MFPRFFVFFSVSWPDPTGLSFKETTSKYLPRIPKEASVGKNLYYFSWIGALVTIAVVFKNSSFDCFRLIKF
jgi:hypothetical protein